MTEDGIQTEVYPVENHIALMKKYIKHEIVRVKVPMTGIMNGMCL